MNFVFRSCCRVKHEKNAVAGRDAGIRKRRKVRRFPWIDDQFACMAVDFRKRPVGSVGDDKVFYRSRLSILKKAVEFAGIKGDP